MCLWTTLDFIVGAETNLVACLGEHQNYFYKIGIFLGLVPKSY
jgi:hypothetical protein